MVLRRDDWLDVARKVDWTPRYVEERELFPEEISGCPWLTGRVARWNEAFATYREYVANQRKGRRRARVARAPSSPVVR
jgi:toluene monooxygenase system protein A